MASSPETELFHTVLTALTGEQFYDFIDRFLNSKVLLPGMDLLVASSNSGVGGAGSDGRIDWINLPGAASGSPEYNHGHIECFQQYKALYESRLKATLKKYNISEEEFITRCAHHVDALEEAAASSTNEGIGSPKTAMVQWEAADPGQICRAIIVMVECIESFEQFAELMAQTQLGEDTGLNDVDIESNGDVDEEGNAVPGGGKAGTESGKQMLAETLERWKVLNAE